MNCIEALKHIVFKQLSEVAKDISMPAYVVGGFVRDFFLGIENDDIDIVVEGSGIEFAKYFAQKVNGKLSYYENYGTAMVKWSNIEIEFVGARKETYVRGSRNPIVEEGTLYDDISRRDFTVNAMAISLNENTYGELIDFFNGLEDLKAKILKTPLNPDITFTDDPLRMFRAVRFASKLQGFQITDDVKTSIQRNAYRSEILTRERITMEVEKMLSYVNPTDGLNLLQELNLWCYAFPNTDYCLKYVKCIGMTYDIDIRWFFLSLKYKKTYDEFVKELKLSNERCNILKKIYYTWICFTRVEYPELPITRHCLEYSEEYAFKGVTAAFIYAQINAKYDSCDLNDWYSYTINIFNENRNFIRYKLPCDGNEISEYSGLPQGKNLGYLMKDIKAKIFRGELNNTRDSVYAYVRYKKMKKLILNEE
jgi:tRNA nucleotidyltransferase/poly(A) polymerase